MHGGWVPKRFNRDPHRKNKLNKHQKHIWHFRDPNLNNLLGKWVAEAPVGGCIDLCIAREVPVPRRFRPFDHVNHVSCGIKWIKSEKMITVMSQACGFFNKAGYDETYPRWSKMIRPEKTCFRLLVRWVIALNDHPLVNIQKTSNNYGQYWTMTYILIGRSTNFLLFHRLFHGPQLAGPWQLRDHVGSQRQECRHGGHGQQPARHGSHGNGWILVEPAVKPMRRTHFLAHNDNNNSNNNNNKP